LRDTGLPPGEKDLARRIVDASDHLLELINGVVDYARLDDDTISRSETVFQPHSLLTEASQRGFTAATQKGLKTRIEIDPALPPGLVGDAGLITRILTQFVDNAVKFTARGGVRLRAQQIVRDGARCKLRFVVEDSGIGIAAADQSRLFQPFSQLDDRPERQFEGIGLGLALAQQLAHVLGGEVGVDSVPGKGSRFWLQLELEVNPASVEVVSAPARPQAETLPAPTSHAASNGGVLPADLRHELDQIEQCLGDLDTRAGPMLQAAAPRLRALLGGSVDEVGRLIAAFDYDQALVLLKSLNPR
jgi:hypothetical protein